MVLVLLTAVAVLAAGTGIALGRGSNTTSTINGCVTNSNGALRVIYPSKGQSCTSKESSLSWNKQGPAGQDGTTILSGSAKPSKYLGAVGDYYIDTKTHVIYGPAVRFCPPYPCSTGWGSGTSLVGPPGKSASSSLPYAYETTGGVVQLPSGDTESIVSQSIPVAGSYSVIATVDVDNTGTSSTSWYCDLDYANPGLAGNPVDDVRIDVPGSLGSSGAFNNNTFTRLTLVGVATLEANATLTVYCGEG
ncbi:MAG: hypothetical protein ABSE47_12215, partial [Acidimicrobiales bacterium]